MLGSGPLSVVFHPLSVGFLKSADVILPARPRANSCCPLVKAQMAESGACPYCVAPAHVSPQRGLKAMRHRPENIEQPRELHVRSYPCLVAEARLTGCAAPSLAMPGTMP